MIFAKKFSNNVQNNFAQVPKEIQTWSYFLKFLIPTKHFPRHVEFNFDSLADVLAQIPKQIGSKSELQLEKNELIRNIQLKVCLELQLGNLTFMLTIFLAQFLKCFAQSWKMNKINNFFWIFLSQNSLLDRENSVLETLPKISLTYNSWKILLRFQKKSKHEFFLILFRTKRSFGHIGFSFYNTTEIFWSFPKTFCSWSEIQLEKLELSHKVH